ncbi:MAG: O-antigen ligase family protein [Candidatus Moranbacteria bacterium]|nr:O-antigen ligase family protein [Candidatus Moranbacteria bacterium]MDD3964624.1 O-antigen ligase family protein [Candidatus Moranbacteria bacterium]
MFKEKFFIQTCLALSILLLPIAHFKTILFGIPLYSVEMPVGVALMIYLYGCIKKVFYPLRNATESKALFVGIVLFCGGAILSFVANPFSWTGLGMIKTWFLVPTLFVWLWTETKPEKKHIDTMLFLWLGVIASVSLLALEYFFQGEMTFDNRLSAWYASPNYLAFFLAPGILLVHYFFFHPIFVNKKWSKRMMIGVFFSLLFVLFHTHSYAVWMSILLAEGLFFFLKRTQNTPATQEKQIVFFLLFFLFTFLFFESGSEKWQALTSFHERSSLASRIMIWKVSATAIAENPVFGIGIGRFQEVYLSYQSHFPLYLEWAVPQPHNLYMALWLQTGIIGLFSFLFLVFVWIKKMLSFGKNVHHADDIQKRSALFVALLSFFLVLGFVDTPFFKTDLAFIFWIIFGLGMSLIKKEKILL